MSDETLRIRGEGLEWRDTGGEVVILDVASSTYFALNPVGAAVWPLLSEGATRGQLLEAILARFDVDEATASRDLDAFLASLRERGLLSA